MSIELAAAGIGAHNAGLVLEDKRAIEELFINKTLRVVVCTSVRTLFPDLSVHQADLRLLDACSWCQPACVTIVLFGW